MQKFSMRHIVSQALIGVLCFVFPLLFSGCDKGYELPPIGPDNVTETPEYPSDSPETPDLSGNSVDEEPYSLPSGSGSSDDPYNIAAINRIEKDESGIWVEGNIVGFVAGSQFSEKSVFKPYTSEDNYTGGNIVISDLVSSEIDSEITRDAYLRTSLPVALWGPFQRNFNLIDHPELFGKRVKIECSIGVYLKNRALIDVTAILIMK